MTAARSFLWFLSCVGIALSALAQATPPTRLLFLGNSLTAGNDVPGLVQALAALHGVALHVDALTPGGYSLEDHWNDGHARQLRTGDYDLVVLQQGPSTLPESQVHLSYWTRGWTDAARAEGTEAALFMVWPQAWQSNGFALVSESYRHAAIAAGIEVFPAGEAWQNALARQRSLPLYSDDLHATPAGSLLAAMVIGRRLFALDPARVPARITTRSGTLSVRDTDLEVFRAVVSELAPATVSFAPAPTAPGSGSVILPAPTGSAPGQGGGGGSISGFSLAALAGLLAVRRLRRPRPAST